MLRAIKKILPIWIKKVPWYIFKSPQRDIGYLTLLVEARGFTLHIFRVLYFAIFNPKLKPISICTGLKNRSENYLNYVVESVLKMRNNNLIELSVFDCQSTDIENLESKINEKWEGSLKFTTENVEFTRAYSMNKAIEQASNELVFITDADMSLPIDLVYKCNMNVFKRTVVWFPICFYLKKVKPPVIHKENGNWHPVGKGIFVAYKKDFFKIGGYNTEFKTWGGEDIDLWYRFFEKRFFPFRTKLKGLFHHYHESLRPADFEPYEYVRKR